MLAVRVILVTLRTEHRQTEGTMTDTGGPVELPTAGVHRRRRIPLIWIVPIVTALIALWLAWDTFSKRGPTITIAFDSAAGLTAGQSQLKYKNVVMGTVKSIGVSPDLTKVIVSIETVREAEPLLNDKTIFWVVKPELFAGNITGLETLLSGSYIGMRPSAEPGVATARLHRQDRSAGAAGLDQGHDLHARQQAAGLDQPRFADLLPRSRGRHGAGLGYR